MHNTTNTCGDSSRRYRVYYKNLLVNNMMKYRRKLERESKKNYIIKNIRIDVNKVNKDKKYFRFFFFDSSLHN